MKDGLPERNISMDTLELLHAAPRHTFYLSSCESGTGIDFQDSNKSSRNSSTSSSSFAASTLAPTIDNCSSIHTNSFLMVMKRLHCITLQRQKHGRYRTRSSSLHLFFKTHRQHVSENPFYKSPSTPELFSSTIQSIGVESVRRKSRSDNQLQPLDALKDKPIDLPNRRTLFRTSDKIVSEDNNTNTMSSVDLATIPPTLLITDTNISLTTTQQTIPNHIEHVSDCFFPLEFLSSYMT